MHWLADGDTIPTRTLVWGAGVAASPLIASLGLPTSKGRLVVNDDLTVPGARHVWALGDAAAVPTSANQRTATAVRTIR
ncbi:MAG: FAD-dependent oxidoreductase [Trebonia sp.]